MFFSILESIRYILHVDDPKPISLDDGKEAFFVYSVSGLLMTAPSSSKRIRNSPTFIHESRRS
jgi:hypothetical protein